MGAIIMNNSSAEVEVFKNNSAELEESYNDYVHQLAYSKYVNTLADNKSSEIISNGRTEHARVIISNLLAHAEDEICILSSHLRDEIYSHESVIESLKFFLSKRKTKIKVLLQESGKAVDPSTNEPRSLFIKVCRDLGKEDSKCLISKTHKKDTEIAEHFIVMDKTGYRFCPDRNIPEAVASFHRPNTALNLLEQFNIIFDRAEKLPL